MGERASWRLLGLWQCGVFACGLLLSAEVRAEERRDPFLFGPRTDAETLGGPNLIGILWDPTHPLAIVGEQMVAVGDRIADWLVVEIQPDGIVIQRDERREFLAPGTSLPND